MDDEDVVPPPARKVLAPSRRQAHVNQYVQFSSRAKECRESCRNDSDQGGSVPDANTNRDSKEGSVTEGKHRETEAVSDPVEQLPGVSRLESADTAVVHVSDSALELFAPDLLGNGVEAGEDGVDGQIESDDGNEPDEEIACTQRINAHAHVNDSGGITVDKAPNLAVDLYNKVVRILQGTADKAATLISEAKAKFQIPLEIKSKLFPFQVLGVDWLISIYQSGMNGILADEMGLGKTIQALCYLATLWSLGSRGPYLIIVPLSTLGNWEREAAQWAPKIPQCRFHGTKDERFKFKKSLRKAMKKGTLKREFGFIFTTYQITRKEAAFLKSVPFKCLVVDEAQHIKNERSVLHNVLTKIKSANRLLLTGTPLQNNVAELWSLLHFILPEFSDSLEECSSWFNFDVVGRDAGDGQVIIEHSDQQLHMIQQLHLVLKPFVLRRSKADAKLTIPPKEEIVIYCQLTGNQQSLYEEIRAGAIRDLDTGKNTALSNILQQLIKVCNHPFLFSQHDPRQRERDPSRFKVQILNASSKLLMLHKILPRLKENGHRVLLFSQMTKVLDILEDYFEAHWPKWKYLRLDGRVRASDRQAAIDTFNQGPDTFLFLISTKAGGVGLNLTTADTVIIYDSDWNPQNDIQAQCRCHRIGQSKRVVTYRLVTTNTVEGYVLKRAQKKMELEKALMHDRLYHGISLSKGPEDDLRDVLHNNDTIHVEPTNDEALDRMLVRKSAENVYVDVGDDEGEPAPKKMKVIND